MSNDSPEDDHPDWMRNQFGGTKNVASSIARPQNARLIAAAPDLLEIAEARLSDLYESLHSGMSREELDAHPSVVETLAAIAKARSTA